MNGISRHTVLRAYLYAGRLRPFTRTSSRVHLQIRHLYTRISIRGISRHLIKRAYRYAHQPRSLSRRRSLYLQFHTSSLYTRVQVSISGISRHLIDRAYRYGCQPRSSSRSRNLHLQFHSLYTRVSINAISTPLTMIAHRYAV